jgi:hypothetical protein
MSFIVLKIMSGFKRLLLLAVFILPACGCTTADIGGKPCPALTFEHVKKIYPQVSVITFKNRNSRAPRNGNGASSSFALKPPDLVRRFTGECLVPAGSSGELRIFVEESSVHKSEVTEEEGFAGLFSLDEKIRYNISLKVRMALYEGKGQEVRGAVLKFERYYTVPASYSAAQRERARFEAMEKLSKDIIKGITSSLRDTLKLI